MTETMTIPYLVIWLTNNDMKTRQETPLDLELKYNTSAGDRIDTIIEAIAEEFEVDPDTINLVNICRL